MLKKLTLKALAWLITFMMIVSSLTFWSVSAYVTESGFEYELINGNEVQITDYTGFDTEVIIPEAIDGYDVTSIGNYAFDYCESLTSITIPKSIKRIGESAFYLCENLSNVYITDIASWCNIEFGDGASSPLRYNANLYLNNELIKDIVIPQGITAIPPYAFANSKTLKTISIPDSVTSIGMYAFKDCIGIREITLSENVETIGSGAFKGCASLRGINLPNKLTSIGYEMFYGCKNLQDITISENITSIDSYTFYNCEKLSNVYITDIASWCNIEFFNWGSPLMYADNLYLNGELVKDVVIPEGVTAIPDYAFSCTSIETIKIPGSVKSIGGSNWTDYENLKAVYIDDLTSWCNINFVSNPLRHGADLYVGNELVKDLVIPEGITEIPAIAFNGANIESLTIPESVIVIGNGAFVDCKNLYYVNLPESVSNINKDAFSGCEKLAHVFYGGTEENWNYIYFGDSDLADIIRHFGAKGSITYLYSTPNCMQKGCDVYNCSVCGEFEANFVEPLYSHDDNYYYGDQCLRCGEAVTMAIPDDYWDPIATAPAPPKETDPTEPEETTVVQNTTALNATTENTTTPQKEPIILGDVNGDGKVNIKDATLIQKYCANFNTGFDIGEVIAYN